MTTFRFADIRADVRHLGADPASPRFVVYAVKLTDPNGTWIESRISEPRGEPRTTADDFDLAYGALQSAYAAATYPDRWREGQHDVSPQELEATLQVAERMEPFLGPAVDEAERRWDLYDEGREGDIGPLDMSGRKGGR